jgi:hypothetical protein
LKSLALVLLRKSIKNDFENMWKSAGEQTKAMLKNGLMQLLGQDGGAQGGYIRRKVCDMVGILAQHLVPADQWPELLPLLSQMANATDNPPLRMSAMGIFQLLSVYLVENDMLAVAKPMLMGCLADRHVQPGTGETVALGALHVICATMFMMPQDETRKMYQADMPKVMEAVTFLVSIGGAFEGDPPCDALEILLDINEAVPVLFKDGLAEVLDYVLGMAMDKTVDPRLRQLCVEFAVTLAEQSPLMVRNLNRPVGFRGGAVPPVVGTVSGKPAAAGYFYRSVTYACMLMMEELQEDAEWEICDATATNDDYGDTDGNFAAAQEHIDRLGEVASQRKKVNAMMEVVSSFSADGASNNAWQSKHAALMGLSQLVEHVTVTPQSLQAITAQVLQYAAAAASRVRYAAVNCIGQLATDHAPIFQKACHQVVIPALLDLCHDARSMRVQAHCVSSLTNFVEYCPEEILQPYMEAILSKTFGLLNSGTTARSVQVQCIVLVSTVAEAGSAHFPVYYDAFMPVLKSVLTQCTGSKEDRMMRCKVLECISLIGVAVGKERFGQDALQIMDMMVKMQQHLQIASDDPLVAYMLQTWTRICQCLGADFVPYLPLIMPPLLQMVAQDVEVNEQLVNLGSSNDDDDDDFDENDQVVGAFVDGRSVKINTAALEDKATACRMLTHLIDDLKEHFMPYVEPVTKLLVPLIRECVYDDVRSSGIATLPKLIYATNRASRISAHIAEGERVATNPGQDPCFLPVRQLLEFALSTLLEEMPKEPDVEIVTTHVQAIKMCVMNADANVDYIQVNTFTGVDPPREASSSILSKEQLDAIVNAYMDVFRESIQRRAIRRASQQVDEAEFGKDADDDDDDEDGPGDLAEEEALDLDLQFIIADSLSGLIKSHRETFLPTFQEILLPKLQEMAHPHCLPCDRKFAIYVFDDIVEFCGAAAYPLYASLVPHFLAVFEGTMSKAVELDASLVQAAGYGIGVAAKCGGVAFGNFLQPCMNSLSSFVRSFSSKVPCLLFFPS